ncbi:hypothetical protein QL285_045372 [Trifolium repens]|nr:hypothetical protein QL285_045372 [Trifolium repens]
MAGTSSMPPPPPLGGSNSSVGGTVKRKNPPKNAADSDEPAMGLIYEAMDEAKEEIRAGYNNKKKSYKPIWDIIDKRWDKQLHRPLHAAGYFLNPKLHYGPNFKADKEVTKGMYTCLKRMMGGDMSMVNKIDGQLEFFKGKQGFFGDEVAQLGLQNKTPAQWWESYGGEQPELQNFAVRVLSLICSSSGCERNWSAFEMIHTKKRNRLKQKTMNDLVYVMVNSRLTKKKVERRRRELTIDDFQDDDDWWYVAEQENAVANQMLADLDAELMHTNGTTSATSPTHEDEFHIADDGEESDNEADDGSGARDGDGDDDDDDDDDDDGGDDDEINEDDDDDIMGDNPNGQRLNDIEGLLGGEGADVEVIRRDGLKKEFWRQLHLKESLLKQKSRMRWVKEGDSNSKYFHESIKSRRRTNQLVALKDGDQWVEGVDEVKGFVKGYFENNFKERWDSRPNLDGVQFQSLSMEDNLVLTAPFTCEEVREVIWTSDGNRSPGPDGFNFNFLKTCWEIIKGDIMDFFFEFYNNAILPKAITASFLTLIPKKDHPQELSDYRPICLISCVYKLLSKVLAARLKTVLGKVISPIQSAFLPNRQILDGVLVVNELLDLAKRRKDKCLFFKVDFERAYDTVNWNFLDYMMIRMGFAEGWRRWIRACIFQSSMSVLVNGSPTEDFMVGKGLRQGDPLSPFLFLIVAEGLTGLMCKAIQNNVFQGYKVSNNLLFHTRQFADDTIIMGEGNWNNLWTIKTVLRSFEIVSGLKVNFYKSKLYGVNLDDNFLRASSSFLHCEVDSIPFRFLGIPVGANPRRSATWSPILESIKKRLGVWNGRNLSIGGDSEYPKKIFMGGWIG